MSGIEYKTLKDIDLTKEYTYNEIKKIFDNLDENKYYKIISDNKVIYTNLYNMKYEYNNEHKFKLNNLTIIFLPYLKEDIDKVKYKYSENAIFSNEIIYLYKPKTEKDLKTEFELSQDNLDDDILFMLFCVSLDGCMLSYASENLKKNIKLILYACNKYKDNFRFASNEIKNNNRFALEILKYYDYKDHIDKFFRFFSENIRNDREIVIEYLKFDIKQYKYIGNNLKTKDFFLELLELNNFKCSILKYANNDCRNDKNLILKCIEVEKECNLIKEKKYKTEYGLKNWTEELSLSISCLGNHLLNDKEIIFECLKINGADIYNFPEGFNIDNEYIKFALSYNYNEINCNDEFKDFLNNFSNINNDREIVILAIKRHGNNFFHASKELQNDIDIVKLAIKNCYWNIPITVYKYTHEKINDTYEHITNVKKNIDKILEKTNVKKHEVIDVILEKLELQILL